ncbi:phosphotransferase [Fundidesulfovibrio putealis]|uniref:phosphotransferase n=1 Tax=Fundidesulfovibrio putealis TaxID=270496 RepID=UPI00041966AC|nr:phosphotransferase [Fundidesulfovibrio putealis]
MPLHTNLLASFGVHFSRHRPDIAIPGSPERCLVRRVIEDADGHLFVLEQLSPGQSPRREAIARLLSALSGCGLSGLAPYLRVPATGAFVLQDWGRNWQLSPYIPGIKLPRPGYLQDASLGDSLGAWLGDFRRTADSVTPQSGRLAGLRELSLPDYIADLLSRLSHVRPDVHALATSSFPALAGFLEACPELPRVLSHGDVHPLNVIWGENGLRAVIDWEFAGMLPAVYDLANCLGCLAIEGDGGLDTPFACALLSRVRDEGLIPGDQARWLTPAILATRFGWLSEWLRRGDEEMISLELDFMEHLAVQPDGILIPGA